MSAEVSESPPKLRGWSNIMLEWARARKELHRHPHSIEAQMREWTAYTDAVAFLVQMDIYEDVDK